MQGSRAIVISCRLSTVTRAHDSRTPCVVPSFHSLRGCISAGMQSAVELMRSVLGLSTVYSGCRGCEPGMEKVLSRGGESEWAGCSRSRADACAHARVGRDSLAATLCYGWIPCTLAKSGI